MASPPTPAHRSAPRRPADATRPGDDGSGPGPNDGRAARSSSSAWVLTLGVSLLIAAAGAWWLLGRSAPPTPTEKSDYFPYQDSQSGQWGYLNRDAKVAIPAQFDHADLFHGLGMVEHEGMAGYVDEKGEWAIAPRFVLDPDFAADVAARPFWGGLAAARREGAWGFIDPQGQWVILPRFEGVDGFQLVGDFYGDRAWFRVGRRYGFIDKEGQTVIEPVYDSVNDFGEGLAGVLTRKRWGFIDADGEMRIRPGFEGVGRFSQGRCAAKKDGQWGYIDRKGRWVIAPKYAAAQPFSEGLAPASNGVAWGYIDPDGRYVIDPQYDVAWPHEHGLAAVEVDGERRYIDANGKTAWPRADTSRSGQDPPMFDDFDGFD